MTVQELIDRLEVCLEDLGPDTEVRLAFQPNYPLAFEIGDVVDGTDLQDDESDYDEDDDEAPVIDDESDYDDVTPVIWITEGGHPSYDSPYAPRAVFGR